ncbi:MAG: 5'/3'-nucleotidase SurE [Myxococcota bacterium]
MKDPIILISNDDGVAADGIRNLALAMSHLGQVTVVAPHTDQSAMSHAMSLRRPLRLFRSAQDLPGQRGPIACYSVDGTPTDAVYMGVHHVLQSKRPDLIVSGINHGPNLGNDVLYSGTVSAAMEGVSLGIPSVAFSLVAEHGFNFTHAATFARHLCTMLLATPLPEALLLNVNVPKRLSSPQIVVTKLGRHQYSTDADERIDPRGQPYYWIGGTWKGYEDLPGTDCKAIADGSISITPLQMDQTNHAMIPWLQQLDTTDWQPTK